MSARLIVHACAEVQFAYWRMSLGHSRQERLARSLAHLRTLAEAVRAGGGVPHGAFRAPDTPYPTFWVQLSPGWLARLSPRYARRWRTLWLARVERTFVVEIIPSPGPGR